MKRRNHSELEPTPLNGQALLSLLLNPVRRGILLAVAEREQDMSSLAHELDVDLSDISHGLVPLREYGLVSVRQVRRRRLCRLGSAATARRMSASMQVDIIIPGELSIQFTRSLATPPVTVTVLSSPPPSDPPPATPPVPTPAPPPASRPASASPIPFRPAGDPRIPVPKPLRTPIA